MLPNKLSDWSISVIIDLLRTGMFESELFDYKESLPHPKDDLGKDRLRRTCCAFANYNGGFLVFGISDDKTKKPEDRLVGLDTHLDFPEQFGNYPRSCSPSIYWMFRNPPLLLDAGKVLHIVQLPKSWNGPHACGSSENGWRFMKRTNKGDEGMAIEEIRSAFLGYYEKRLKLQLLRSELIALKDVASGAYFIKEPEIEKKYSLSSFDTRIIDSVIADTYSITASYPDFLAVLNEIRQAARETNNKIRIFFGALQSPIPNFPRVLRAHNEAMRLFCEEIVDLCQKAVAHLDQILSL